MVSQLCLMCGSTLNCQTLCLGARPRYSLVVDEDVKEPTNQPTIKITMRSLGVCKLYVNSGYVKSILYIIIVKFIRRSETFASNNIP